MAGLSDSQLKVIRTLIDTAPDAAIRSLDLALASEPRADTAMSAIRDMVSTEAGERRLRAMVFGPVLPLCPRGELSFPHETFPPQVIGQLWRALKQAHSAQVHQAIAASQAWTQDVTSPEIFDELCLEAAAGLLDPQGGPFQPAFDALEQGQAGDAAAFATYLKLSPIARQSQAHLPEWLGRMTDERAAVVRLAFRDADAAVDDARPLLFEMLLAGLDEPWLILRVVSAIQGRPTDVFLAGSELADLGERVLDDIDRRLDDLGAFDLQGGAPAGAIAAEAVRIAVAEITEMEQSLELKKDGPWGRRVIRQKQILAQKTEALLTKTDSAIGEALPLKSAKFGKGTRGVPSFKNAPDARAVVKAEALLAFLDQVRAAANPGGFASLRTKAIEKLDERFDVYVEDVLEHLRTPEPEQPERAREYLEIAADLIASYRDEKSAQIVRRRAAA